MRTVVSLILLVVIVVGIALSLADVPFGVPKTEVGSHYIENGRRETGAANVVTSVVVGYRGFDTLGEVTVLFVAAVGLGAVLAAGKREKKRRVTEPASLVLSAGCRLLFPLLLLLGAYVFIHGHLTPGGGFQGGAIITSAFLLVYLGCRGRRVSGVWTKVTESVSGLVFVVVGLVGLAVGGHFFLSCFLPIGNLNELFSAGIIPIIYVAIGFKVGSELAGVIDALVEETE